MKERWRSPRGSGCEETDYLTVPGGDVLRRACGVALCRGRRGGSVENRDDFRAVLVQNWSGEATRLLSKDAGR